jgi:2-desacetyl-2-hydroxyethyl bacteriochlorophyllide A dehydrogenase
MNALTCVAPGRFEYQEINKPLRAEGNTILKMIRVGICGTDFHSFKGTQPYFSYPRILGHELAAEVVETDRSDFEKGEPVTIIPYFNCGQCIACRNGRPNCCASLKVCGVHIDGGMASYFSVPSYSLVHAQGLTPDQLTLVEPFAIGAHAIRRAGIKENEFVLVSGAGPIGLAVASFASIAGARVIITDINKRRLEFCMERWGIQYALNAGNGDIVQQLMTITNGDMPSIVIDATGSQKAINGLFQYMSHGAKYILVGLQKEMISFSHPEFHKREATLMSSRNATREDFEFVIDCMIKGRINHQAYITHHIAFSKVKDEFEKLLEPAAGTIKAIIEME